MKITLIHAVERLLANVHQTTERWSDLTPSRFKTFALTLRGLRPSRATLTAGMRLRTTFAIGMSVLTGVVVAAQSGNDLFQQALVKERTDGNLTEVIPLYEKIVQQHGSDRKLAAKALYQIGQAYEKLGQAEARKAYERIAREFADQKDVAADAGRRLAVLSGAPIAGRPSSSLVWRHRNAPMGGSVSSDGRYLSFVDWATGDLALRDVATGQERRIAEAKNKPKEYNTFAEESVISRDGQRVAYNWFERSKGRPELRIASLSGVPNPRQLYDDPNVNWLEPRDWSPDGNSIAVLISLKNGTDQISLVSVADGSLRVLRSGEWRGDTRVFFSPDGKYVGYDLPQGDANPRDIWVTATDGTGDMAVAHHPSNDVMMGWSPDGKRLLFRSDRSGSMALWSLPVRDGKPQGAPEMIKADMGQTESLGVTQSGALFYGIRPRKGRSGTIQIGAFDFGSGKVVSQREVSDDYLEENSNPCWSPDGKYLAYVSTRDRFKKVIVIRSAETNRVVRELPHGLRQPSGGLAGWEPNSRALLLAGENREGQWGAFRFDVEKGDMELLFEIPRSLPTLPVWSADGRSIYCHRKLGDGDEHVFVQREIATGVEKELIRRPVLGAINVSPDGRYLATESFDPSKNDRVLLFIPLHGGEPRVVMRIPTSVALADLRTAAGRAAQLTPYFWASDSLSLIASMQRTARSERELWRIPVDGGSPRKLDAPLGAGVRKFTLNPNGRTVAYRLDEATAGTGTEEVWVLENFFPPGN